MDPKPMPNRYHRRKPRPPSFLLTHPATCDECGAELVEGNSARKYGPRLYGVDCHHGAITRVTHAAPPRTNRRGV